MKTQHDRNYSPERSHKKFTLQQRIGFFALAHALKPITAAIAGHEWRGLENIPRQGPVIVCPNHMSEIDPVIIGHMLWNNGFRPHFMAKESLFKIPVLGKLLVWGQQIPVTRGLLSAGGALKQAKEILDESGTVVVYPEGTLTKDPALWPMKGKVGAARLALETGAPVVPVAHWGVQNVLAPYARRVKLIPRGTFRVLVGEPVDLSEFHGQPLNGTVLHQATAKIQRAIVELLAELREQEAPEELWSPAKKNAS